MTRNVQWLNENAYRTYPFTEDGHVTIAGGALPTNLLLDLQCTIYSRPQGILRLAQIVKYANTADLVFRCTVIGYADLDVTVAGVPAAGASAVPYVVRMTSAQYELTATLGQGLNEWLTNLAVGTYVASASISGGDNLFLEPTLVLFHNGLQVTSIQGDSGPVLTGGVKFQGGYGVYVSVEPESNTLRFVGGPGLGDGYPESVPSGRPSPKEILRGINGVYADGFGNIQLIGGNGIDIRPDPDTEHQLLVRVSTEKADIDCGGGVVSPG